MMINGKHSTQRIDQQCANSWKLRRLISGNLFEQQKVQVVLLTNIILGNKPTMILISIHLNLIQMGRNILYFCLVIFLSQLLSTYMSSSLYFGLFVLSATYVSSSVLSFCLIYYYVSSSLGSSVFCLFVLAATYVSSSLGSSVPSSFILSFMLYLRRRSTEK